MSYKFLFTLISFLMIISCSDNDVSTTELAPTSTPLLASTPIPASTPLPASTPIPVSTPLPDIKQVPTVEPLVEVKEEPKDDDFQEGITFKRNIPTPIPTPKTYEEIMMAYEESQKKKAESTGPESTDTPIMTYEELQKKWAEERAEELLRAKQRESLVKETFDSLDNPRRTSQYLGWGKFYDVESLRLFATERVTDQFMLRVAATYKLMFGKNDLIDDDLQNTFFKTIRDEYVFQKILYMDKSGNYDETQNELMSRYPGGGYQHNSWGNIVYQAGADKAEQKREIVLQVFNTMGFSLRLLSDDLDGRISNSVLRKAYEEAVDKNLFIYNPSQNYSQEDYINHATNFFLVRVICKEWGITYLDTGTDVIFRANDKDHLINNLPLSHKLYEEYVEKILNPLDPELFEDILEYNFEPKIY